MIEDIVWIWFRNDGGEQFDEPTECITLEREIYESGKTFMLVQTLNTKEEVKLYHDKLFYCNYQMTKEKCEKVVYDVIRDRAVKFLLGVDKNFEEKVMHYRKIKTRMKNLKDLTE